MENGLIRKKIISESVVLFMEYGIRSVTMDDIARHLGMSKKTIYQHFKDKEEIILVSTQDYFRKEHERMVEMEKCSENAVEALFNLTVCIREQVSSIKSNVLFDLKKYYQNAWEKYNSFKHDVIYDSVLRNMNRGISEGLFRSDINPRILAHLRIGEIELSFNKDYFPEDKFSLIEIHEQLFEHFTYGILSEKGCKLFETYKQKQL
jgi:AcrR family transcriptional regulator